MSDRSTKYPWGKLFALLLMLVALSVVAFVIASIEGFIAGVVLIFIGFFVSFFRDDVKRYLGLSYEKKEPIPVATDEDYGIARIQKRLAKLENKITKERTKIEKVVSKYQSEPKHEKQQALAREIVETATVLLAIIDQAKSCAIHLNKPALIVHYDGIHKETYTTREQYRLIKPRNTD